MKGDITLKILETIGDATVNFSDLWGAFLGAGYGASYGKIQYLASKQREAREKRKSQRDIKNQEKQKYYNLIYKLKRDGLLKEEVKHSKKWLFLTAKGREKIISLKTRFIKALPENNYPKESGDKKFLIVIFDIPEVEKKKRVWLRLALRNLNLSMLQRSVWAGKVKIPKLFIDDLRRLRMTDFVEIFEISKTGSLKHII